MLIRKQFGVSAKIHLKVIQIEYELLVEETTVVRSRQRNLLEVVVLLCFCFLSITVIFEQELTCVDR